MAETPPLLTESKKNSFFTPPLMPQSSDDHDLDDQDLDNPDSYGDQDQGDRHFAALGSCW